MGPLFPHTTLHDPVQGHRRRRELADAATLRLFARFFVEFLEQLNARHPLFAPRAGAPRLKPNELAAWIHRSIVTAAADAHGVVPSRDELEASLTPFDLSNVERQEVIDLIEKLARER